MESLTTSRQAERLVRVVPAQLLESVYGEHLIYGWQQNQSHILQTWHFVPDMGLYSHLFCTLKSTLTGSEYAYSSR